MIVRKQKYYHGGVHPTREEKRQQMLDSGMWTEGPNGELLRVPTQDMFGFPTTERAQQLSQSTEPLNEQQLSEYIRYGFSPTNPVNTAFSMIAGAHPAAAAADVVGNVIGKGLGYVAQGGRQLMNFLRPAADEIADAATAGFAKIRPDVNNKQLREATEAQMTPALEESGRVLTERMGEFMSEEGQRRARNQIVDQLRFFKRIADVPEEELTKMGMSKQEIITFRHSLKKFDDGLGGIDASNPEIDKILDRWSAQVMMTQNRSSNVVGRAAMAEQSDEAIRMYQKMRDKAMESGNYARVEELNDRINQAQQAAYARNKVIADELTNATYTGPATSGAFSSPPEISLGREFLLDPTSARHATVHEFQHGMQDIFGFNIPKYNNITGRSVEADRVLDDLILIDPRSPKLKTAAEDPLWGDYAYFETEQAGYLPEKTPFLAEVREDMLDKGFISHRYDPVDEGLMDRYLKDYWKGKDVNNPSTAKGTEGVRLVELMDNSESVGKYNRELLTEAMNKMLVAVPAVGAAGLAAGTTAENQSSYYKGGKLKLKKHKRAGMRLV